MHRQFLKATYTCVGYAHGKHSTARTFYLGYILDTLVIYSRQTKNKSKVKMIDQST